MQLSQPMDRNRRRTVFVAAVLLAVLIIMALLGVFGGSNRSISASRLRCVATQDVTPFGDSILYYDSMTLYCLNARGGERWSYTLGQNAFFSCSDTVVAAWTGTQLHLIDRDGHATYNESLADVVQFVRVGSKYVAVALGADVSPTLLVKDMQGTTVDNESAAFRDTILLDMGFFSDGEYLWTTALDVYGSVPDTTLNTFRVNMRNSGSVSLGEHLVYGVIYAGGKLNVISTRQLRQFDYRGTQDVSGTMLVYGWQLIDHAVNGNKAMLLFTTSKQTDDMGRINQLRLIYGATDKRFTLPIACVGAALNGRRIYAFSSDMIYRADMNDRRFTGISLPKEMNGLQVTGYLGMLNNGTALLACDSDVYAVTLP